MRTQSLLTGIASCLVLATGSLHGLAQRPGDGRAPEPPKVSVPPGKLSFEECARLIAGASKRILVSDGSLVPAQELSRGESALPDFLRTTSARYDVRWSVGDKVIVGLRGYRDPRHALDLEIEELREISSAVYRLHHPYCPTLSFHEYFLRKKQFFDSLTPEQRAQARLEGGLPFAGLTAAQHRQWVLICRAHVYSDADLDFSRAERLYRTWSQSAFHRDLRQAQLSLRYTDEKGRPEGEMRGLYGLRSAPPPPPREQTPQDAVVAQWSPTRAAPLRISTPVRLDLSPGTVQTVCDAVARQTGVRVDAPPHALQRRVTVICAGGAASDLLDAVGALYGWELKRAGDRKLRFSRVSARPTGSRDPRALHRAIAAVLPPTVRVWVADYVVVGIGGLRGREEYDDTLRVLREAEKVGGPDWTRVAVRDLPDDTQRQLANRAFRLLTWSLLTDYVTRPEPRWYLVAPESGWFTLEGEEEHPALMFQVQRPDGKQDTWGWGVGTSLVRP